MRSTAEFDTIQTTIYRWLSHSWHLSGGGETWCNKGATLEQPLVNFLERSVFIVTRYGWADPEEESVPSFATSCKLVQLCSCQEWKGKDTHQGKHKITQAKFVYRNLNLYQQTHYVIILSLSCTMSDLCCIACFAESFLETTPIERIDFHITCTNLLVPTPIISPPWREKNHRRQKDNAKGRCCRWRIGAYQTKIMKHPNTIQTTIPVTQHEVWPRMAWKSKKTLNECFRFNSTQPDPRPLNFPEFFSVHIYIYIYKGECCFLRFVSCIVIFSLIFPGLPWCLELLSCALTGS